MYSRYIAISKGRNSKHIDQLDHEEDKMLSALVDDVRFTRFRRSVLKELDEAVEELARSKSE
jgi:hypothetical protein